MLEESLLSGLVVIRSDGEDAIHAESRKLASEEDHFRRVVAARAPKDWHLALAQFDGDLNDAKMLFVRKRGAFARGSTRNEEVDACLDLPLDQSSQCGFVKRTITTKRCDKCSACACKHDAVPFFSLSPIRRGSREIRIALFSPRPSVPRGAPRAQNSRGCAPCGAA